jgi:hypothetical protein
MGDGREGARGVTEGVELIKEKYFESWDTLRNPFKH